MSHTKRGSFRPLYGQGYRRAMINQVRPRRASAIDKLTLMIRLPAAAGVGVAGEDAVSFRPAIKCDSNCDSRITQELIMTKLTTRLSQRSFLMALIALMLAFTTTGAGAKEKTEDELIAELASPKEKTVTAAMLQLEKKHPNSERAVTEIKKYLGDERPAVRRKAARVLGAIHAEVTPAELQKICALLKATDYREIMDGLIALRGLKAAAVLPQITPLLQHQQPNVIRDACRTIAVLGNKSHVPLIEPLLEHANAAVQKDAKTAIFKLNDKA
jgi:HEAT repeat protein